MSEIKPFTGVDNRTILADVIPLNTPFTIGIAPSNVCNFKCNYCVQSLNKDTLKEKYDFKKELMTLSTFKTIVEQLKQFLNKVKLLTFMGQGEPLLNKDLSAMIRIAKKADIAERIDIVTNASLLTHELSDELIDAGLDVLRISLQGMSSKKYKEVSNIDIDFIQFISNIEYFYRASRGKCKLYVKIMNTSLDKNEENKFYSLFNNISDRMFIEQLKPVYDGVSYPDSAYDMSTDRRGEEIDNKNRLTCSQCFFTLSVWPSGFVNVCSAIHKIDILGNVNTNSLFDMWNSKQLKDFQIMQLKGLRYNHPQCKLCQAPLECAHKEDIITNERAKEILEKINA